MYIQEHFLDKVIGLCFVAKNSLTNTTDDSGTPSEELRQSITITCLNACYQVFVGIFTRLPRIGRRNRSTAQLWPTEWQYMKA